MYHANVHTNMMIFNIFNQLKHIPLESLVTQWVKPFTPRFLCFFLACITCSHGFNTDGDVILVIEGDAQMFLIQNM